ncbi:hypothetical protein L6164_003861 [Bauhinia variegata]|uniref:Uncharacterized protein n=1 Tax=Bauhinia variegata TaxID=167791 RepID=A0ACB9Q2L7_BAUVA|nr:hypothetical protein L6164_003861 [Bauhinia variegata]
MWVVNLWNMDSLHLLPRLQCQSKITSPSLLKTIKKLNPNTEILLKCFNGNLTPTCPAAYFPATFEFKNSSASACPDYFRWIHEDLKPWKSTGITREMVERARDTSHFRLVILKGKAYVEKHAEVFQTRDVFTIWGILQLLRLYPAEIPDLELLFECGDRTVVKKARFQGPASMSPPPVFHYCGHEDAYDIVFPDWTFWGWAETDIRPWKTILQSIEESNKKIEWKDREPYAFWKGNTEVSSIRQELSKCIVSEQHDWNARIYPLHWDKEVKQGFKNTKLENQCTHRYKIYVEGSAWSVSEKYILACDSMTLFIKPKYYDFFSRSMIPLQHYWPISTQNICNDIKFAVDWGNTHTNRAQVIGKEGSNYIQEKLEMKFVYDYMFHLLREYANLMRFEPRIPSGAVEICYETVACPMVDPWKEFMEESMVKSPSDTPPCAMPAPDKLGPLQEFQHTQESLIEQVEMRKGEYFRV